MNGRGWKQGARCGAVAAAVLLFAGIAAASPAMDAAAARARAAGVPPEQVGAIVRRANERLVRTDSVVAGLARLEAAARDGLPTGPIADKILEGLAKRVPADRLGPAVDEVVTRLTTARRALGELSERGALVEEAAEALRRGAPVESLRALSSAARHAPYGAVEPSIRELAELGERGVADELAGRALGTLAAKGYPASVIDSISGQLEDLLAEGGTAPELLGEVHVRALAGRPIERLVDPFAEGGPAVIRDRHARPDGLPGAATAAAAATVRAPVGPEGAAVLAPSPLDRQGAGGAVGEEANGPGKRPGGKKK
jgi:hypothetical protein